VTDQAAHPRDATAPRVPRLTAPPAPQARAPATRAPTLSVVIPYHRGQAVIGEAVRSVLAQTLAPEEIVICDDGSPDDLDAGLGELREHVRVVRRPNGGIAAAMNALTDAARGDYLVQLDQDDAFEPGRLEALARVLTERPDIDVLATDARIELDGRTVATLEQVNPYPATDGRIALLRTCTFLWPAIRREALVAAGGYDTSLAVMQDWECFLRLVLGGAVTGFVHEPLYRWRLTPGSRSSRDRVANVAAQVQMTEKVLAACPLDERERAAALWLLAARRRRLELERARAAVIGGRPGARRLSARMLAGAGFDRATRAKALVAVVSPALARRFMERRSERSDPAVEALARRGLRLVPTGES